MTDTAVDRRDFLCTVAGCAQAVGVAGCTEPTHTDFFRKHLEELSPEQVKGMIADLEREYSERFGKDVDGRRR